MIDFDLLMYATIAAFIFFSVSLALCLMWRASDPLSKAGKLRKILLGISLVGLAGVFVSVCVNPLMGVVVMFIGLPFAAVVLFLFFLIRFCWTMIAKKKGIAPSQKGRSSTLTVFLIASFVFVLVMIAVLVCLLLLPAGSIAYM